MIATVLYKRLSFDQKLIVCRIVQEVFANALGNTLISIEPYNFHEGIQISLNTNRRKNRKYVMFLLHKRRELNAMLGFKVRIIIEAPENEIDKIQNVVCSYFNVPIEMLQSITRKREIVQSRQVAMYLSKILTKSSLATIGSQIGDKDHATVLHACKTVNNLIETDKRFKMQIEEIERRLKND